MSGMVGAVIASEWCCNLLINVCNRTAVVTGNTITPVELSLRRLPCVCRKVNAMSSLKMEAVRSSETLVACLPVSPHIRI
jgi:hypothetical protein